MPVEVPDAETDDDQPRKKWSELNVRHGHWWWPAVTAGRIAISVLALTILGAFLYAGNMLKTYLERDARFRIVSTDQIEATGIAEVTRADLLPVFGEDIGRNIFFIPLAERRRELESIPWIEHATVMRLLPGRIRVDIVERKPVAFTRRGQQIGLVDANGVLLDMPPAAMAAHHYSFPVLTGIDPGDSADARRGRMALYMRLMGELDANNQHYSEQISEIDLTDPEDARVLMPEQGADILAHFGEDHFLERYQRYKSHIAEWRQQYPRLASVDLRYQKQVVLDMNSASPATDAANTPATAASAAAPPAPASKAVASVKPATARTSSAPQKSAKTKAAEKSRETAKAKSAATHKSSAKTRKTAKLQAAEKARKAEAKARLEKRKRAESKAVALKVNHKKTSPVVRPSATEGQ